jgi:hypothetical protein
MLGGQVVHADESAACTTVSKLVRQYPSKYMALNFYTSGRAFRAASTCSNMLILIIFA